MFINVHALMCQSARKVSRASLLTAPVSSQANTAQIYTVQESHLQRRPLSPAFEFFIEMEFWTFYATPKSAF
jgi:hypothetical protein